MSLTAYSLLRKFFNLVGCHLQWSVDSYGRPGKSAESYQKERMKGSIYVK